MSIVKTLALMLLVSGTLVVVFAQGDHHDLQLQTSKPVSEALLSSNQYTQPETDEGVVTNPYVTLEDRYDIIADNDVFELYVDPDDLSIRIKDQRSGYLWGSSFFLDYALLDDDDVPLYPDLYDEDDRGFRSQTWRAKANSPVWIGYYAGATDNPQFREESLYESDQSTVTLTLLADGFDASLYFGYSKIRMTLQVRLTPSGLDVKIPNESISDNDDAKLSRVSVYPFMGAVKKTRTPGYIMVPDGIGALIRFDQAERMTSVFEKPFYGYDPANSRETITIPEHVNPEKSLYLNAYGMVHGVDQNGYLAIVKEGAPYASMVVYPAGVTTDFFFTYANFTYRTVYRQPLNQSQTNTIVKLQDEINPFDLDISYVLLTDEDANYVGMASAYRSSLIKDGILDDVFLDTDVSLHLDVIAAENKKALFGRKTIIMTDLGSLWDMIESLSETISHLSVTYRGYGKGGLGGSALNELPFESGLGSKAAIIQLNETYDIYHVVEPTKGYPQTSGYNPYDLAIQRNLQNIGNTDGYGSYYLMHPSESLRRLEEMKADFDDLMINHVALASIGSLLYGTYGDEPIARGETVLSYVRMIDLFDDSAVFDPMGYMLAANRFFDVVLYASQRAAYSDTVPFMSYVLKGLRPMYGRYGNFFANTQNELLRLIDYGIYPSFVVTETSAYGFLDTSSQAIYTSEFSIWKDEIERQYAYVRDALSAVVGERVVQRTVPTSGVVLVTYSNNVTIGINYSDTAYIGLITIPAGGYALGGVS
ncbi:MAG: hypothetical protein K9K93_06090 [Acholeplasmataceae bacterium]|nr:hypothetical protein [Acholeplasmataceae bacterium]